ncbi:hypothetical protein MBLNU13_g09523t1 [Cladosporium sp. NU13]
MLTTQAPTALQSTSNNGQNKLRLEARNSKNITNSAFVLSAKNTTDSESAGIHSYQTIDNTYTNIIMSQRRLFRPSASSEATKHSLTPEGTELLERLETLELDDLNQQVRYQRW